MPTETLSKPLYDEDVVTWSDQQAEALRDLARAKPRLANAVDWENVIEEIESVGRSEWRSVESQVRNVLTHVIKGACDRDSLSVRAWRGETRLFLLDVRKYYRKSMAAKFHIDDVWADALLLALGNLNDYNLAAPEDIPRESPFTLDDLLDPAATYDSLVKRLFDLVESRKP